MRACGAAAAGTGALALTAALVFGCGGGGQTSTSAAAERWRTLARSTVARTEVAAARIGDSAYVVGGFAAPDGATSDVVERYDLRLNRWARVRPIPQAVNHAAAVAHRGELYAVGGYTAASGLAAETNALWRYDPAADRWAKLPAAPSARGALAAATVSGRIVGRRGGERGHDRRGRVVSSGHPALAPRAPAEDPAPRPRRGLAPRADRRARGGPTPGLTFSHATESLRVGP